MKNRKLHNFITILITFALIFSAIYLISKPEEKDMSYNSFTKNLTANKVSSVSGYSQTADKLVVKLKNDDTIYIVSNPQTDEFRETLLKHDVEIEIAIDYSKYIVPMMYIFILLLMSLSLSKSLKKLTGGEEKTKTSSKSNKKFKDVVGLDEIKKDLLNIVDMVKHPEKCKVVGAKIPRGILLDGPPGNGKTLLAKALAGECEMSFYSANASEFIEKYVGMGAMRVRNLFNIARKTAPSIIFIDEIDSIGCKRTGSSEGADKEYTQCLNAILAEMDGFNDNGQVLVIAATNRVQDLDEALVRAGRFDMKFTVGKPDYFDRVKLLKYYLAGKSVSRDVIYDNIAKETTDFSSSEIENLVNVSAFKAVERNSTKIEYSDFNDALIEILTKGKVKKDNLNEHDFKVTCYHEAGHAIMTLLKTDEEILRISALPSSSGIGGFTMSVPKTENKLISLKELKNQVLVLFAGRAAEFVMNGGEDEDNVSLGASNDIWKATNIIKYYLIHGSKERALLDYSQFDKTSSDARTLCDCEKIANELWSECVNIIRENFVLVQNLAYKLMDEKIIYNYKLTNIDLIK